jgi:CrcB protein
MWQKLLLLSVMGIAGTLSRYWLQGWVQNVSGSAFPWGTFAVNAVGCLAFGVFWGMWERQIISLEYRTIILVGFMGAFTTFSSFAFETGKLLEDSQWFFAMLNVLGQNIVGVFMVLLGMAIGRWI